ncbi:hydrogenase maturation protease [candidate division KSB1 bacterium]|nr:hydrogenase maturation protease [candidate division KSB1 bacterium]
MPIILCLGNEIISDDRFGYEVAEALKDDAVFCGTVEVHFAARAGFELIPLLAERPAALVVDTIRTGHDQPGTVRMHDMGAFAPSNHLVNSHQISLPTALALARLYGIPMPASIEVLTVEAADLETLSEALTVRVAAAVAPAQQLIRKWLNSKVENHVSFKD